MISRLKTPVAVLRQTLGLSFEDFGKLIGKSFSTVTKLDNNDLPLSEETAQRISAETGVSLSWLLAGKPEEKPYFIDSLNRKQPYLKEIFDLVQARKKEELPFDPALNLIVSLGLVGNFLSIYHAAAAAGRGQLAAYLIREAAKELAERLGKNDEEFLQANADVRIIAANGSKWAFASFEGDVVPTQVGGPTHIPKRATPKTIPVLDVPHDSDGNTDWNAIPTTAAPEPTREKPAVVAMATAVIPESTRKRPTRQRKEAAAR
jgi:transcriptional regulator with XRE-family HTH domain